mmetsp:Transcript_7967/g.9470  ORF Transcript_7967/g.9470 Transcript_7967/m.9470 type:complete len:94 (+) Transcript_7967:21-302(+)
MGYLSYDNYGWPRWETVMYCMLTNTGPVSHHNAITGKVNNPRTNMLTENQVDAKLLFPAPIACPTKTPKTPPFKKTPVDIVHYIHIHKLHIAA